MKIGIVCYPTFGGSGIVATELGMALAENDHEVHFITFTQPVRLKSFNTNICYHEVSVAKYDLFQYPPYEIALASKIVDVAIYEQLDIIHVHYAIPHASAAYMAKQILENKGIKLPIVTTLHGTDITLVGKDASYSPVVEFSINQSDGVTAVSRSLRQDTFKHFDIKQDIEVIPNFIDFNRFKHLEKDHFKKAICPNGEKLVIHVSNFRPVKRVQDTVHAFNLIRQQMPAKLLLVGDGPDRHNCEKLCRMLGACDDIRFLGKQDAVEELLAVSDLFMLPSESESFGLAALEAMACGVPVIATNAGGIPEVIEDGECGYLSVVGDFVDMADKSVKILKDEETLARFKANALKQAQKFHIQEILPKYEEFYKRFV